MLFHTFISVGQCLSHVISYIHFCRTMSLTRAGIRLHFLAVTFNTKRKGNLSPLLHVFKHLGVWCWPLILYRPVSNGAWCGHIKPAVFTLHKGWGSQYLSHFVFLLHICCSPFMKWILISRVSSKKTTTAHKNCNCHSANKIKTLRKLLIQPQMTLYIS